MVESLVEVVACLQTCPASVACPGTAIPGWAFSVLLIPSPQSVNSWKTGQTRPSLENLREIFRFYGVVVDYILGLTDVKSMDTDKRTICDATGLSEDAVIVLQAGSALHVPSFANALLESKHLFNIAEYINTMCYSYSRSTEVVQQLKKSLEGKEAIEDALARIDTRFHNHNDLIQYVTLLRQKVDLNRYRTERALRTFLEENYPDVNLDEVVSLILKIEDNQQEEERQEATNS